MKKRTLVILMAAAMVLSACGQSNVVTSDVAPDAEEIVEQEEILPEEEEAENVTLDGEVDKSVYMDPTQDVETRVNALLAQMTLEEKAAQLLQPEQAGVKLEEITQYGIGSVLSGGGSAPTTGNMPADWENWINKMKQAALDSRLGIPLLYGIDAVHGNNNVYGATIFPHNIGLGAAADADLMEEIGRVTAKEVRACGIQWTFAPTLGNALNERWGRTYECFSENPQDIAVLGEAYIRGFQGEKGTDAYLDNTHVLACAKHYIGEGYTADGKNQGDVEMSPEEFDALLASGVIDPYTAALNAGVRTVMVSYNSINGLKCHENKHLVQELLKDQLGFTGFVVSDYNGIQQTSGITYKDQVRVCLDAGVDMFMEPYTWQDCMKAIISLVEEGSISQERLDDAVSRILRVKFEAGLFEEQIASDTEKELFEEYGSAEHREIAKRAVRESLVLLKNEKVGDKTAIEALKDATNIQMIGQKAYDLGAQCGGWTITWQGLTGKTTIGTTVIEGISNITKENGVGLAHNVDGTVDADKDAVIVVVGENPYAESDGDRAADSITVSAKDVEILDNLRTTLKGKDSIPVVAVIIAGRPVNFAEYMDLFDAVVMAWLPGTEGDGIAEVLFGDYDFTGTLTYTWLKDFADLPMKKEAALAGTEVEADKILFPKGFGLKKDGTSIK